MTVVQLTTDNREPFREYDKANPWFGTAPEALLEGFAELSDVQVHVVSCTQQRMRISPEKLAPNIWFHSLHVPKLGWMKSGYLGCVRAVRRKVRELAPDIVHGQGTERDCGITAILSGFPSVVTIHGNMLAIESFHRTGPGAFFHWSAARLETFTLRRTAGVFCNSAYTEAFVAPRARKTWRVPNALRPTFFAPPTSASQETPPVLLNVGVISPRKRQLETLALATQLHTRGLRFCVHFLGALSLADAYGREFAARLAKAEAEGYAKYVGTRARDELMACFDRASALLHFPSEESFGLVAAEGLARNLKLFAMRVGGIIDIATGVEGAELVEEGRWDKALTAVAAWLEAGAPRPAQAAETMGARYHPRAIAARHLEIYREVLAARV